MGYIEVEALTMAMAKTYLTDIKESTPWPY